MVFSYLISEDTIKTESVINENVFSKDILNAIRYAQDIFLTEFIGKKLYYKLMELVDNGEISLQENSVYKELLDDYIKYFLMNKVVSELLPIVSYKIANAGVIQASDEHITNAQLREIDLLKNNYSSKADSYAKLMSDYLRENKDSINELSCKDILNNAFESPIWLGGARGYRLRKHCCKK